MIAKQLLTTSIVPLKTTETGADALFLMDENKISDLPVVDNAEYIGLISEGNIYNMSDPDLPIADQKLSLKNCYVNEYQHVFDVIKTMSSMKLTVLPVLDEKSHYIGSITVNNLLEYFSVITAVNNPGSIVVLELNQNDYVLSQIAQIVESQDAKILNLYVTSDKDSTKMEVTMKINKMEIQSLIQTFNRYNYIIKATYTEDENMYDDLRDRYNSLMNYLNI
ncbi:MAG: CBS domain-containing protein [Bacteroidetes bacterium]|nr:CBS domain-containing protein [Bacteroidota bacterium]MBL7103372.1 CBS domain-containing protein [Bacteroidales bacterium]